MGAISGEEVDELQALEVPIGQKVLQATLQKVRALDEHLLVDNRVYEAEAGLLKVVLDKAVFPCERAIDLLKVFVDLVSRELLGPTAVVGGRGSY